ncbi:MAG: hypothetical protein IID45_07000, partial [Planctomycetes bacterium]|nr:hypothetical protein [Planctomycetota bacterium]
MSTAAPPQAETRTSPHAAVANRERSPRKPPRQLSAGKRTLFLLVMLAVSWISIEGMIFLYLRSSGFYWNRGKKTRLVNEMPNNLIPNDRYIWGYEPGSKFTYTDPREKATYSVKVNSEGFRDEEPAARQGAAFQFVALGDSFTFGWLVQQQERWDEVLARVIQQKHGISSASVNRGMWMTTFDQHTLILEDNFPEKCSAVIHFVYPSHLQTINRHTVKTRGNRIVSLSDPMLHL